MAVMLLVVLVVCWWCVGVWVLVLYVKFTLGDGYAYFMFVLWLY